jgi:hypothetical protein
MTKNEIKEYNNDIKTRENYARSIFGCLPEDVKAVIKKEVDEIWFPKRQEENFGF